MDVLASIFTATVNIFQIEFDIFGFTMSFWDVFIWTLVASGLIAILGGVIRGD